MPDILKTVRDTKELLITEVGEIEIYVTIRIVHAENASFYVKCSF